MAEDRSSAGSGDTNENGIWRGLKALIFGGGGEDSLRDQLEEAIDRHEDDPAPDAAGDLSPLERQMVRNLLHFGERDAGDVGVPRADIVAVEENTAFEDLVRIFADAGHSRLPVYREKLDTIIGMVHIKDVFAILATGAPPPWLGFASSYGGGFSVGGDGGGDGVRFEEVESDIAGSFFLEKRWWTFSRPRFPL